MKLQIMSDLHLEFGHMNMSPVGDVLVLAGDVGVVKKPAYLGLVEEWATHFEQVIYVPGNHEYYKGDIDASLTKLFAWANTQSNITVLDNSNIIIDDVLFIGSTLWTYISSPVTAMLCQDRMNDYHVIRQMNYGKPLTVEKTNLIHIASVEYIQYALKYIMAGKAVVVTHHAPSLQSIHPMYKGDELNAAFATDLEDMMLEYPPNLWIHGHMHHSLDYMVEDTRVICNPRGYVGHALNEDFDKTLTVEI